MTNLPADIAVVVAGHGSRDPQGVEQFERFIEVVRDRAAGRVVAHGYLEFSRPTIDEGVRKAVESGAKRISVVPGVLLGATHAKNDMPVEVQALQREFPDHDIRYGAPMHLHPAVLQLCRVRVVEAEARSNQVLSRAETCLVVVGRGTTDPDANSDVSKLARILEEGMGFGASFVCYSGTAEPGVAEGFEQAARMGFKRLIVVPFFLFTGVLIKRIEAAVAAVSASRPQVEVLQAGYLGSHALTAEALLDRAREAFEGKAHMNCSLCKYRTAIIGYESETGAPQQGHHFHVRAGGAPAGMEAAASAGSSPAAPAAPLQPAANQPARGPYEPHPIEAKSFEIIAAGRDWSAFPEEQKAILQRLVHTAGDFSIPEDVFLSRGAPGGWNAGDRGPLRHRDRRDHGSNRAETSADWAVWTAHGLSGARRGDLSCGAGQRPDALRRRHPQGLAQVRQRSAAGHRRCAHGAGGNGAPDSGTRLAAALVIGLPVGFVGTQESKERLRKCLHVPRITNRGTRGGSPWAAAAVNALLIESTQTTWKP
jgi:precorrin-8X/cobalt-precorrin-8 methylmutase